MTRVETFRMIPVRLRAGHRNREVGLQGVDPDGQLHRVLSSDGRLHPVPTEGIVLGDMLARLLDVSTGEPLQVEFLEGRRVKGTVRVAGVFEDFMGLSAVMSLDALHRLARESDRISGAYLLVDAQKLGVLGSELKATPAVSSVSSPPEMLASFEERLAEGLSIGITFLMVFASVISVAVVYNGSRVSLSERGRELASLRVMGFRRREVATLLLGEQAVVTAIAIPLGFAIGTALSYLVVASLETETYRVPLVIRAQPFAVAAVITSLAALASGWIVRRRIDRLDLVNVLKTRE